MNKNLKILLFGALIGAGLATLALIFITWGFSVLTAHGPRVVIVIFAGLGCALSKEIYNFIKHGRWNNKDYD